MALFALLSVLVFSFALELDRAAREEAISGVLWVTLIFASILGFNRSMANEQDAGNFDALRLAPISRSAIFVGKLVGNCCFTLCVGLALLPLMTVLYGMNTLDAWITLDDFARCRRFFNDRHTFGDYDSPDEGARGAAADCAAANGLAFSIDGCAGDEGGPEWRAAGGMGGLAATVGGHRPDLFCALSAPV